MKRLTTNFCKLLKPSLLLSCCVLSSSLQAIELFDEDELGNVNQRNVGVFKSNKFDDSPNSGEVVKRNRALQPYTTLKLEVPVELEYFESGRARAVIEADEATINRLNFVASGDRLTIRGSGFSTSKRVKIKIYGNDLQRVFVNTAADVSLHDIGVNAFFLSVRGAADVSVKGSASRCQINTMGASDLDLSGLACQSVVLTAQGSSDVMVSAAESIKGQVQGAGDVEVLGSPAQRDLTVLGAYDVDYR